MAKSIYLNSRSDVPSILKLVKQAKSSDVVLVVPKSSILFRTPGKIRKLASKLDELGVEATVATTSAGGRKLASSAGFAILKGEAADKVQQKTTRVINDVATATPAVIRESGVSKISKMVKEVLPNAPVKSVKKQIKSSNARMYVGGAVVVLIGLILVFFFLPSAHITIASRSEPVTRDIEVEINTSVTEPDVSTLSVPGEIVEKEAVGSVSFTPTGRLNIGKQASGFVQIYNFSKTTLILRADTTTLNVSGREYRFTQDVSGIRPTAFIGQGDDQEVDPSSLTAPVPVAAVLAGEEFNLQDGARIEIDNEVFGSDPKQLYAVTSGGITGGTTQEVKVVTENDVLEGLEVVRERIISEQADELSRETEGLTLLESGVQSEVIEESVSHNVGDQASEFTVSTRVNLKALAFSSDDVQSLVTQRVTRLLPENKTLLFDEASVFESRFFVVNFEEGTGILTNHFESRIVYELEPEQLKSRVTGKNEDEIKEILLSRPEIDFVEVQFTPFWVKKAPKVKGKISLTVEK